MPESVATLSLPHAPPPAGDADITLGMLTQPRNLPTFMGTVIHVHNHILDLRACSAQPQGPESAQPAQLLQGYCSSRHPTLNG